MQTGDLDERRIWACEVEVAEKAERRVPGDRFAMNPMHNSGEALRRVSRKCRMRHPYDIDPEITTRGVRPYTYTTDRA
jgi:hypothetical protein